MTAQELKERYDKDLKELQESCPHDEAKWMPFMWAPGHFAGEHLLCSRCWKVVDKRP